ncbi:glycerophosphoryl diester phosphodiesterase membrane domain-containing protein [Virgibacillus oceani]
MYSIFKESLRDFTSSYKNYLSFEIIYTMLASFLFVPLLTYIFNKLLSIVGVGSLLNAEVYKFGMSFPVMLSFLLFTFLAVAILFVEFGVLITISQKRYFKKSVLITEALVTTLKKLPKLLGIGVFQLILLLVFIIPFIDSTTLPPILDVNITIFLTSIFYESAVSTAVYIGIMFVIGYAAIRWIFTLHFIFIEDSTIWQALKKSWKATRSNQFKLVFYLFLANLIIFTAGFLFMRIISYIAVFIDSLAVGHFISEYILTLSSYTAMIGSLFLIPINIIILTRWYYHSQVVKGATVQDQLSIQANQRLSTIELSAERFFNKRKKAVVFFAAILVSGIFFINYSVSEAIVYLKWDVAVASHRGDLMHAPENSMSSIRSALDKGVNAIEIDIMMTKDGVIVLNHDDDLQRTAGVHASIKDMTYEEVAEIDIGILYDESFTGERIPTMEQVLEKVTENDTLLILDLKSYNRKDEFTDEIVRLLEKYDAVDQTYVQSFNYDLLQEVRAKNEEIKIGQVLFLAMGNLSNLDIDFYTIRQNMLTSRFIENAHQLNREVWVWTVNSERNVHEVLKYNIDGIITDYPERVQQILEFED